MPMLQISVQKILHTAIGERPLSLDFSVERGEFLAIYGKSGAGKTTTLRMLAGLSHPDSGQIIVDGECWFDAKNRKNLPPQQRTTGMVFQDYALFPNMTVRKNLAYALAHGQSAKIIDKLLLLMDLATLEDRSPETLSGGQRQRVALARALVRQPKLLLLDEPLSALDDEMRRKLQDDLLRLHQEFGMTTILVSHSIGEIFKLCNRVLVLDEGKQVNIGAPADVLIGKQLSGKFKFEGEILAMTPSDVVVIVTVAVGNTPVRVIATPESVQDFRIGDRVIVAAKAFNPVILPAQSITD